MTAPSEQLESLRSIPLFSGLSDEGLGKILDRGTEFECASGHVLISPGEPGAGLFLIEDGTVAVELPDRELTLGRGDFLGELALLDERGVHTGRVRATSAVRALAISRDDLSGLLDEEPALAKAMLRALARRLADATARP